LSDKARCFIKMKKDLLGAEKGKAKEALLPTPEKPEPKG